MRYSRRARALHHEGHNWERPPQPPIAGFQQSWDLVITLAQRGHQPKLVLGIGIKYQRSESTVAILCIVEDLWNWGLKSVITPVSVQADVVGKSLRVAAATDLVVGLIKISEAGNEIAFLVAFKTGSRHDVENSIGAVSICCVVA